MRDARERLKGSMPALITPFKSGEVDEAAFRRLVSWQIAEGSHGLVPAGTTGELATLSHEEHQRVVEICIDEANGRVPVIAGAGSNSTDEAIALTKFAKDAGPMRSYRSRPITIARPRKAFTAISRRSPTPSTSRSSSTTSRPQRGRDFGRDDGAAFAHRQHRRREGRDRQSGAPLPRAACLRRPVFGSSPVKMRRHSATWRMAVMAASRSRRMSHRSFARNSRTPACRAPLRPRSKSRIG